MHTKPSIFMFRIHFYHRWVLCSLLSFYFFFFLCVCCLAFNTSHVYLSIPFLYVFLFRLLCFVLYIWYVWLCTWLSAKTFRVYLWISETNNNIKCNKKQIFRPFRMCRHTHTHTQTQKAHTSMNKHIHVWSSEKLKEEIKTKTLSRRSRKKRERKKASTHKHTYTNRTLFKSNRKSIDNWLDSFVIASYAFRFNFI